MGRRLADLFARPFDFFVGRPEVLLGLRLGAFFFVAFLAAFFGAFFVAFFAAFFDGAIGYFFGPGLPLGGRGFGGVVPWRFGLRLGGGAGRGFGLGLGREGAFFDGAMASESREGGLDIRGSQRRSALPVRIQSARRLFQPVPVFPHLSP